jgi:hypothetical protein
MHQHASVIPSTPERAARKMKEMESRSQSQFIIFNNGSERESKLVFSTLYSMTFDPYPYCG